MYVAEQVDIYSCSPVNLNVLKFKHNISTFKPLEEEYDNV